VSFFIVVSAAVMIYQANGGPVDLKSPAEAAVALKPFAKGYAEALFAIGLFNASLLAAAVLPLSTAYTYCESFGWEIGVSRRLKEAPMFFGIYTLSILFGAAVVLLPDIGLIDTMIRAQAINGILLPVILIFMLKLINSKEIMGKHTNTKIYNIAVWGMAIVLILMTLGSLVGAILGY
jgi:Mn2+/Fe2+ NRAMP family transporter